MLVPVLCYSAELPEGYSPGHGQFIVSYQYIHVDGFEATAGTIPFGTTDTYALNFGVDYQLNERWGIDFGIPLVRKRYQGDAPHNPMLINPPQDAEFIDTGSYHTNFQDWHLALRFKALDGNFGIEPFLALGVPSNDYPFFAHSAVGQRLTKVDVGTRFTYQPGLADIFYRLDVSYVFVEKTLGVNINHWRLTAEAGYFFSPRFSGRAFFLLKEGNGLKVPEDFPPPRDTEYWYQHDRMVRHNYINAGLGIDWSVSEKYQLSLSAFTMVYADQVHIVKYALTASIARAF